MREIRLVQRRVCEVAPDERRFRHHRVLQVRFLKTSAVEPSLLQVRSLEIGAREVVLTDKALAERAKAALAAVALGPRKEIVEKYQSNVIVLDSASFPELAGVLDLTDHFASGDGATAADENDFLVYDTATGVLSYDADGSGAGEAVALATIQVSDGSTLDAPDFLVV